MGINRFQYLWFITLGLILGGCAIFKENTSNNPKSCIERAAYHIADIYPDPTNLGKALVIICPEGAP